MRPGHRNDETASLLSHESEFVAAPAAYPAQRLRPSPWLRCFSTLEGVTILAALAAGAANAVVVHKYALAWETGTEFAVKEILLRSFAVLLCWLAILAEADWRGCVRSVNVLDNWVAKGLLYVFIGTVTYRPWVEGWAVWVNLVACGMCLLGALYVLLGTFCCRLVKEASMLTRPAPSGGGAVYA